MRKATDMKHEETTPHPPARLVQPAPQARTKVLFIGYDETQTGLIQELIRNGCEVWHTAGKISSTAGYDLVISYGYRHILKSDVIHSSPAPIVNLHISYLPWNRGAHPNFWSFFDSTPSGVSIHLIDEGVDTGPIIAQRYVNFKPDENTFAKTYNRLIQEIEALFVENLDSIVNRTFRAIPQRRSGTHHRASDLPEAFGGWDTDIQTEITRLDKLLQGK